MPSGPRRPGFYLGVLIAGFVAGGALNVPGPADPP